MKRISHFILLAVLAIAFTACQSTAMPQAAQPTITREIVPTSTPVPPTNPPVPPTFTLTPIPPTATSTFTATPIPPTPTPILPTSTRTPIPPTPTLTPTRSLLGKIAYNTCEGDCGAGGIQTGRIWIANADGSGARQILDNGTAPALSPNGDMIAYLAGADSLYVANADGSNIREIAKPATSVEWSHNGQWLAFSQFGSTIHNKPSYVAIIRWDGSEKKILGVGSDPTWSPDDTQIAYKGCVGDNAGKCGVMIMGVDGSSPRLLTDDIGSRLNWSPQGDKIIYQARVRTSSGNREQLFLVNVDGSGRRQITFGTDNNKSGTWSLDGNYIYYCSDAGGRGGIWVMNADGTNPRRILDNVASISISVSK